MLSYKGYIGSVDFDDNADTFFGTVINSTAIISFRGSNVTDLRTSFHDCVDAYLDACAENGTPPEKPFNGKFSVRVSPELHRRLAIKAAMSHKSMNSYIEDLIETECADIQ